MTGWVFVCVCVCARGVLAMFAQLPVLFSQQTSSWSCSHGLISSSNTNVNEGTGTGDRFSHVLQRHCVRCDSLTTCNPVGCAGANSFWSVLSCRSVMSSSHLWFVPHCVLCRFNMSCEEWKTTFRQNVTGKYYLMLAPQSLWQCTIYPQKRRNKFTIVQNSRCKRNATQCGITHVFPVLDYFLFKTLIYMQEERQIFLATYELRPFLKRWSLALLLTP